MQIQRRMSGSGRSLWRFGIGVVVLSALLASGRGGRVAAQEATPVAGGPATVTVLGHGSTMVAPDIATVTIGVQIMKPDLADAQSDATKQMNAILKAIKKTGIDEKDIRTSNYNVYVMNNYDENGNASGIVGYQVSNQVDVVVRDLDSIGSLLQDVVAAGANTIWGITFGVEDPTAAASESRAKAVADAKTRATELAEAAGLTLGRVLSISEGVGGPTIYPYAQGAGGKGGNVPVQAGNVEIAVDVQVTFELV